MHINNVNTPVDVSVIIVNYNTAHLFELLFKKLAVAKEFNSIQTIFVDNASKDDSLEFLDPYGHALELIKNNINIGFGRANNQALNLIKGRYVLLLNTDAFVAPDTLSKTMQWMDTHQDCGILGVTLVGRDGVLQPSCRYFPTPFNSFLNRTGLGFLFPWVRPVDDMTWDHASVRECDWVPGCYYLIRREVIDEVGLFDPRFFMYYEEVDHCRRTKAAGWKVMYYPDTQVIHLGGESAKTVGVLSSSNQLSPLQIESELLYFRKHYGLFGVSLHLFLVAFGDVLIFAKHGFKRILGRLSHKPHSSFIPMWRLFRMTVRATLPTR
jgi:N-acetylglucosaminyl-diphospho-decaprenol L-rhamnosyltransferase